VPIFKKDYKEQKKILQGNIPSEEEIKLSQDINKKYDNAKMAKAPKVQIWKNCIAAYNSEYFKSMSKPDYKSDEISNFIFSTIETIKPIMTDNNPKIMVLPKKPTQITVLDNIQNIIDFEWSRAKMELKLPQAITLALQIGTAIIGMFWDGDDDKGVGNVTPTLINPFNFFVDPFATDMDNAEYAIYATYKHVNQLKNHYPDKANLLNGGAINNKDLVPSGSDVSNVNNQVLVLEAWLRDYTTMDIEEEDEDGNKVKKRIRKYPNGRRITCAPELNVILDDGENPYDDGKFPFTILKCYDVPFEFWGKGEIEQLLSPQTYINDLMNQIIDNAKLTANMPWVIDKNSGIGKGQLTNRPGLIIRKNPGSEVKRLQPLPMPSYVAEMVETLKRDIEVISGIHDVTQGRKPGSISAASAIIALQEAAQARIRLKVKLMEQTLGEMGKTWYNRIKQFWIVNRYIRFENEEGQIESKPVAPKDLEADVDFVIVAGSTMPTNKSAMLDLMIRLAQTQAEDGLPMVDRETVLQYTNVPDKKKIIQRFMQLTGQMQQEAEIAKQDEMSMAQQEMASQEKQAALSAQPQQIPDEQLQQIIQMIISDPNMLQMVIQAAQQQAMQPQMPMSPIGQAI
jgi:hypothetical protein